MVTPTFTRNDDKNPSSADKRDNDTDERQISPTRAHRSKKQRHRPASPHPSTLAKIMAAGGASPSQTRLTDFTTAAAASKATAPSQPNASYVESFNPPAPPARQPPPAPDDQSFASQLAKVLPHQPPRRPVDPHAPPLPYRPFDSPADKHPPTPPTATPTQDPSPSVTAPTTQTPTEEGRAHGDPDPDDSLIRESEERWKRAGRKPAPRFAPGVDTLNAGKTKQAKSKRKEAQRRGEQSPKSHWQHKTFLSFSFFVGREDGDDPREAVVAKMWAALELLQEDDPHACYGPVTDGGKKTTPLAKLDEFPVRHKDMSTYFFFNEGKKWQFEPLQPGQPKRKFVGTVRLFSDVHPDILLETNGMMDMRSILFLWVKEIQALETVDNLSLLLAPNDINPAVAADHFRELLASTELEMIAEQELEPRRHPDTDPLWNPNSFPQITGKKAYPRGGEFIPVPKKARGERVDTSHKMAIQFQYAAADAARVEAALHVCKQRKYHRRLFGDFAVLLFPPPDEASPAERKEYQEILRLHSTCTRSYNVVTMPGLLNTTYPVYVDTPRSRKKGSGAERITMSDALRYVKAKSTDGKDYRVVQCCFPGRNGEYNMWYPGTVPAVQSKAEELSRNPAAYCLHQFTRWGWTRQQAHKLLVKSFDSDAVMTADSSKWDATNQRVVCEAIDGGVGEAVREFKSSFWGSGPTAKGPQWIQRSEAQVGEARAFNFDADDETVASAGSNESSNSFVTVADYDRANEVHPPRSAPPATAINDNGVPGQDNSVVSGFETVPQDYDAASASTANDAPNDGGDSASGFSTIAPDSEMTDANEGHDSSDDDEDDDSIGDIRYNLDQTRLAEPGDREQARPGARPAAIHPTPDEGSPAPSSSTQPEDCAPGSTTTK